jgi:hypothetical protein
MDTGSVPQCGDACLSMQACQMTVVLFVEVYFPLYIVVPEVRFVNGP